ncbi:MAG: hypothetical protein KF773_02955 [Deltaproteobacteria bacterium]|nr:hypothetical protein [Deltaproteobacteria bacterium]
MHDGDEDLQDREAAAAQPRRLAAAAAAVAVLAGAGVASADGEALRPAVTANGWQTTITGWVQVDAVAFDQNSVDELEPNTREPLNRERFVIPRGRLRAEARREVPGAGALSTAVEADLNTIDGPLARILAAQVGWTYPARGTPLVAVTAGLFRTPFGMEVPMSERVKPFLEAPSFARALFPGNYDTGVTAQGAYGLARWQVAIVNGAPAGDAQWRGRDPTSSYDLVGRLGAVVDGPRRWRFAGGVSALTGTGLHPGKGPTKDELQWVDDNQDGIVQLPELQVLPGSPAQPSLTFERQALGADVQAHWCLCRLGEGMAFFEVALATNLDRGLVYADPVSAKRDLRHLGYAIGVVQEVGKRFLVGIRYDRYDADRDAFEQQGFDIVNVNKIFSTLGAMATVRWQNARLLVQYDQERNPFGRGDDGQPITRRADKLTIRAQVGF